MYDADRKVNNAITFEQSVFSEIYVLKPSKYRADSVGTTFGQQRSTLERLEWDRQTQNNYYIERKLQELKLPRNAASEIVCDIMGSPTRLQHGLVDDKNV